ncbi:hypothetical protein ACOI1C_13440 [Bacillus sp. DJP31]|uniref:hypothetical protein n=1 Tax=Bacillus sp. DJP31 TaxID=3409789 RepID=UPI003BB7345C
MAESNYIKINAFLLLAVIPLSIIGYLFTVHNESFFFLYEWLLVVIIVSSMILSVISVSRTKTDLRWASISILAFLIQFSVLGLFLGPFTEYGLFTVFYIVTFIAFAVYVVTLRKINQFKFLPIIFIIISIVFTLYMILLNSLWGSDIS